jgi:hypothetical protein
MWNLSLPSFSLGDGFDIINLLNRPMKRVEIEEAGRFLTI